jgi:hypothetical protein
MIRSSRHSAKKRLLRGEFAGDGADSSSSDERGRPSQVTESHISAFRGII